MKSQFRKTWRIKVSKDREEDEVIAAYAWQIMDGALVFMDDEEHAFCAMARGTWREILPHEGPAWGREPLR